MKGLVKTFNNMCSPARLYFIVSCISILIIFLQNLGNSKKYNVGKYGVNLRHHNIYFFIFKLAYIFIWTFILNKLCKKGWNKVSWYLVLIPYLFSSVIIAIFLLSNLKR